jgi:hypothetical protein
MKAHEAFSEALLVLSAIVLVASLPHPDDVQSHPEPIVATKPAAVPAPQPIHPAPAPVPARVVHHKAHTHTRVIVVSLQDRRLALLEDGQLKQMYTVAVGKESTPSPTGTFTIVGRVANPTYFHDGKVVPPGPANPVGTRWMGLSKQGYGIHGTNAPRSIGKAASHGCIRMAQPDLENLFAQVRTGDTVEVIGERNEETASLFGEPAAPNTVAAPAATTLAQIAPQTAALDAPVAATMTATAVLPLGQ